MASDWCCCCQSAAARSRKRLAARSKASTDDASRLRSKVSTIEEGASGGDGAEEGGPPLLPPNAPAALRQQLTEAAMERSYQKSPRRNTRSPSIIVPLGSGVGGVGGGGASIGSTASSSSSSSGHDIEFSVPFPNSAPTNSSLASLSSASSLAGGARPRRRSQLSRQSTSDAEFFKPPRRKRDVGDEGEDSLLAASTPDSVKMILLGAGESGKSTIAKQMKLLHGGGYTHAELVAFRPQILRNVVEAMQQVLLAMRRLGLDFGGTQCLQSQVKSSLED